MTSCLEDSGTKDALHLRLLIFFNAEDYRTPFTTEKKWSREKTYLYYFPTDVFVISSPILTAIPFIQTCIDSKISGAAGVGVLSEISVTHSIPYDFFSYRYISQSTF